MQEPCKFQSLEEKKKNSICPIHVSHEAFIKQTHLIESLDHPFVPVAEHVQPLHLPLPEHLWRHILSAEDVQRMVETH